MTSDANDLTAIEQTVADLSFAVLLICLGTPASPGTFRRYRPSSVTQGARPSSGSQSLLVESLLTLRTRLAERAVVLVEWAVALGAVL